MKLKKLLISGVAIVAALSFTGCVPVDPYAPVAPGYGYNNPGNVSNYYSDGRRDGCRAKRKGNYRKDQYKWNNYNSYRNGWKNGYRNCTYNNSKYSKGRADGCWSKQHPGNRKNQHLYNNNIGNYAKGWRHGWNSCKRIATIKPYQPNTMVVPGPVKPRLSY